MGFFDFLPCCGPRPGKSSSPLSLSRETTTLLPPSGPGREGSFLTTSDPGLSLTLTLSGGAASGGGGGVYGATTGGERLTEEQLKKIQAIRESTQGYMLPVQSMPPRSHLSMSRTSTAHTHLSSLSSSSPSPSLSSSRPSSRPSSPAALSSRTVRSPEASPYQPTGSLPGSPEGGEGEKGDDVVRKQLFMGNTPMGRGGRKPSGGAKAKAKKGKGKK
ncbi:hypothetical protein I350_01726 [Cryptococcus amylolentus CBS 6273]|uniref:Uncharacterized protein n=1 Tax=Cryptococcus amylolentus CBS 6273 TaxID=1296118 RepID=A0A1E3KE08_9TREE|nr:hypothetical protein I350_01726 [Cryptococcus amylolentus CBS 6273]